MCRAENGSSRPPSERTSVTSSSLRRCNALPRGENGAELSGNHDPPPLKWSDLRYVFDSQEGHDGKEALQG